MSAATNSVAPATPVTSAAPAGGYPSDEDILGIFDERAAGANGGADRAEEQGDSADGANENSSFGRVRPQRSDDHAGGRTNRAAETTIEEYRRQGSAADAGDQHASNAARTNSANDNGGQPAPASIPEWLAKVSAAAPDAAPELATLWQRAEALEQFDRAYYGGDAAAQQQLVTQLYADDPAALRSLVAAASRLVENGIAARAANAPPAAANGDVAGRTDRTRQSDAPAHENDAANAGASSNFNPAEYAQFERTTNDAVVSDVGRAIERALDRALPDGIADGARKRIAGDTLAEVHAALRGDRRLAAQVAETLRGSRFDSATRDAITRLITSRARGVVPEAARRVIGEWTGSVLATHRERTARQQASGSRVDVIGGALPQAVPQRAVKSADIDYRATSDEDILSW